MDVSDISSLTGLAIAVAMLSGIKPEELADAITDKKRSGEYALGIMAALEAKKMELYREQLNNMKD